MSACEHEWGDPIAPIQESRCAKCGEFTDADYLRTPADHSIADEMLEELRRERDAWRRQCSEQFEEKVALRTRLEAAEAYIAECPCDPDIYPEQWEAYERWRNLAHPTDSKNESSAPPSDTP